jgi:phosphinothricin acetyltransferase
MKARTAMESDLPAILAIYNHAILTSTAVYDYEPDTMVMRQAWFAAKTKSGMPVFVSEDEDGVSGFATYGAFRNRAGYRYSVEHSVYISEAKRGLGHGRLLLSTLIEAASRHSMHTMIASVDAQNEISIHLHLKLGFAQVAHFREVGYKFDRWLDLIFLQKILDPSTRPDSN